MSWRGKGGEAAEATSVDSGLDDLFTRLSEQAEAGNHKKALKLCDDVLKVSPGDADAIACKVVALVELTRYDAAVECCAAAPQTVRDQLAFEHAYALYRSHDVDKALAVLEGEAAKDAGSFRVAQLRAQLLYRDGRAEESAKIYEELFTVRHGVTAIDGCEDSGTTTSLSTRSPRVPMPRTTLFFFSSPCWLSRHKLHEKERKKKKSQRRHRRGAITTPGDHRRAVQSTR